MIIQINPLVKHNIRDIVISVNHVFDFDFDNRKVETLSVRPHFVFQPPSHVPHGAIIPTGAFVSAPTLHYIQNVRHFVRKWNTLSSDNHFLEHLVTEAVTWYRMKSRHAIYAEHVVIAGRSKQNPTATVAPPRGAHGQHRRTGFDAFDGIDGAGGSHRAVDNRPGNHLLTRRPEVSATFYGQETRKTRQGQNHRKTPRPQGLVGLRHRNQFLR